MPHKKNTLSNQMAKLRLGDLPRDVQEKIFEKLDPKSRKRMSVTSKEMQNVIRASEPPTGSYIKKTGRFQRVFSIRKRQRCKRKILRSLNLKDWWDQIRWDENDITYETLRSVLWPNYEYFFGLRYYYLKNCLLKQFREKTKLEKFSDVLENAKKIEAEWEDFTLTNDVIKDMKKQEKQLQTEKIRFRRSVIRLIRQWSEEEPSYKETLKLLRRRKKPYKKSEETSHRDRLMDAILVQTLVPFVDQDPTRVQLKPNGTPYTLKEKVNKIVRLCSAIKTP